MAQGTVTANRAVAMKDIIDSGDRAGLFGK